MGLKERVDNLFEEQRRIEESLRFKRLKEKEAVRVAKEEKFREKSRIIKERKLLLIKELDKLPIREILTEIRDDEWKIGEIVVVPGEPKIKLIAKWPRLIPDYQEEVYEQRAIGDSGYSSEELVGYKPMAGYAESQWEIIEIGARWKNTANSKKQAFYSLDNLPQEFYWFWDKNYYQADGKECVASSFAANMLEKMVYGGDYYHKEWEGYDQSGSSSLRKKMIVVYGHAVGKQHNWSHYYSGFEGPSINNPNVVSKIEESLIKMCLVRREEEYSPPFDRYKEGYKLEAMEMIRAGRFKRGFKNIPPKEIKKIFV